MSDEASVWLQYARENLATAERCVELARRAGALAETATETGDLEY